MEQVTGLGVAHRSRRRPAADPARAVRPERRHARGGRRAGRARAARPHRRRLAGRVDHVRGRAQHLGRADRRVDRVRQRARRARAAAARGPRRRACTRPTRPERWLVVSVATDEQWSALVDALGRPDWATDPDAAHPRRPPRRGTTSSTRSSAAWAAETDLDKAVDLLVAAGVPAAPAVDARAHVGAPAVRRPRLLRDARASGDRRARAPVAAVPLRRRRPLDPHRGADRSASTTTRSSTDPRPLRDEIADARGRPT